MYKKKQERGAKNKNEDSSVSTKTTVTIPYVKAVSEAKVFHCIGVATVMKPHLALKRMLNERVVYLVPCKNYPCVYTGETERRYRLKEKEHQWNMRSLEVVKFTQATMKDSVFEVNPSAIMDHVAKKNHTIDLVGMKYPNRDSDTMMGGIWEAIAIKRTGFHAMNHDICAKNFHCATSSCCHVTPEGSTNHDSSLLGIKINL